MERCGHDRERNNNNVTKLADRECLLHACSESKHCNGVFTLYFSWQLSTNNFCHLFHVQSRKSVKGNLLCLRLFLLRFSSPASSTCQAAFMFFFLGWWHLQPYSVTIWTWIITHWSVWCTLTLLSKKHWRLLNYLVTLFPFVTLGRKVYSSVHKLHVGPSELCPVVCQFSQENVLWCFMVHLFASEKAASTCRWFGKFSFLEIAICQTNNTWFSPASNRFLPATSGRWMFLNDTSNKQALPLLKA